ncbi:hypothetical protein B0H19DRAFT_1115021 [Mycena capillaripes]|nr:hypothetical protein B0H19DRAFT_1115021 [Mycena capillaripes]
MDICGSPRSWSLLVHTSWPLEYALRVFDQIPPIASSPKHQSTQPAYIQIKPTLTGSHILAPTFRAVATACSLAIIGSLVSLAFLLVWRSQPKPPPAHLSESTVLRIHDMASRQPYHMPPDGDGDPGTFAALPFARNPRKQSLFMFWVLFLLIFSAVAYVLSPLWQVTVFSYIAEKRTALSWTLTLILSLVLANIAGGFLQFVFFLVPIIKLTIQWTKWIVFMISVGPTSTFPSAYLQIARVTQYLSHWYFGIPQNQPLPHRVECSTALVSSVVSAASGYHLISSRVARNYTLLLKSAVQGSLNNLFDFYVSLQQTAFLLAPTTYFQGWAWWSTKHILKFTLGELSWTRISWPKLSVMLAPTLIICAYSIYKYNQVIKPPRSILQLALDPIHQKLHQQQISSQRRDVELVEIKRLLQSMDARFADAFGGGPSVQVQEPPS